MLPARGMDRVYTAARFHGGLRASGLPVLSAPYRGAKLMEYIGFFRELAREISDLYSACNGSHEPHPATICAAVRGIA